MTIIFTKCINSELPLIYGSVTDNLTLNIYNQDFFLEKSIDVVVGEFVVTLNDIMDNNVAFVLSTTNNDIESNFFKLLPICYNNEEYNTTC